MDSLEGKVADQEKERRQSERCVHGTFRDKREVSHSHGGSSSVAMQKGGLRKGGHLPKREENTLLEGACSMKDERVSSCTKDMPPRERDCNSRRFDNKEHRKGFLTIG